MGTKTVKSWLGLLAVALVVGGCALQDDLITVDNRLTALKQRVSKQDKKVEAINSEIDLYHDEQVKSDEAIRSKYANLHALIRDLRHEIAVLRGYLEESQYDAQQKLGTMTEREKRWKELEKSFQSSLDRIVRLEQYLAMEPSEKLVSSGPEKTGTDQGKPSASKTPDEIYAGAKQEFDKGEYEAARELFQSFLKQYPKSKNADNAQFWIGEIYYREKWYEKAILEYQKVIETYPKGNKTHSALLKQGYAFLNLGDKDNARLILKELIRKYPDSNEAKIAKEKLKRFQ
ncbi:MAG: tol-pal system protein YbgF [Desulfobacterales bacterium]|nr:tol-pal system protein YbgF [Desulfobacterales bacterium]